MYFPYLSFCRHHQPSSFIYMIRRRFSQVKFFFSMFFSDFGFAFPCTTSIEAYFLYLNCFGCCFRMAGMREKSKKKGMLMLAIIFFLFFFTCYFFLSSILLLRIKAKVSRLRRFYCILDQGLIWSGVFAS